MDELKQPKRYPWGGKVAVFAVVLIITGAILTQSNFLEGLLKFLGVGASTTEQEDQMPKEDVPVQLAKVELNYNYLTASANGSIRINVAEDGKLIIEKKDLNMQATGVITLEDVELNQGEQYVVVLEGEGVEPKILYFVATEKDTDEYSFTFGRFYPTSEQTLQGDFNGDGEVNSVDFQLFMELWQDTQSESS